MSEKYQNLGLWPSAQSPAHRMKILLILPKNSLKVKIELFP